MKKKLNLVEEHICLSNYWYFKNNHSTRYYYINLNIIKKFIIFFLRKYFNVKLINVSNLKHNYSTFEKTSRITQKKIIGLRDKLLVLKFSIFFKKLNIKTTKKNLEKVIMLRKILGV